MSGASYPPPPWQTRGWAVLSAYRVPAADARVPEGFEVESVAGMSLGLLGIVDYRPPSPLAYRELVWMPARVRVKSGGRTLRGFWVAKMLVDHQGSLRAGREVWALPKQRARFVLDERAARVESEDGATIELSLGRRWPGVPAASSIVTVQARSEELVRFRGDTRAKIAMRRMRVVHAFGLDGTWGSFERATPIGSFGVELRDFRTVMQPPQVFPR